MRKPLVLIGAAVGVLLVALFWSGVFEMLRPSRDASARHAFVPDLKNDKRIAVRGLRPEEIDSILTDFAASYGSVFAAISPAAARHTTLVSFPRDVPSDRFFGLVNFLTYAHGADARDPLAVVGKVTLTPAFGLPDPALTGRKAFVYVPDADEDHDVVYVDVVGEAVYALSFPDLQWQRAQSPRRPPWLHEL